VSNIAVKSKKHDADCGRGKTNVEIERNEAIAGDGMEHQMAAFTGFELECKTANVAKFAICVKDKSSRDAE
jgi:hypothetical protein